MDRSKYNEIVQAWMNEVENNCMQDAELTLKYCNDIIQYGIKTQDESLIAYGHFYSGVVYYVLNDGTSFFEAITEALSYLTKLEEWELMARSYNFLGITAMNRGNAVIAADYYRDAIQCALKGNLQDIANITRINAGSLNIGCGRYEEAIVWVKQVYDYYLENTDVRNYAEYMAAACANLAKACLCCGKLDEAKIYLERLHENVKDQDGDYLMISVLCTEAMYYHIVKDDSRCEELIARIHKDTSSNIPIMDMFDDYYDYCKMLLERGKDEEFWHIIEVMEPLVKNLNFLNLQLKLIGLKIKFYRKNGKGAEYLQAAGLYYELSERLELETRTMINTVLNIRKNLETVKKENEILLAKSETDPLTQLSNRARLNAVSEEMFRQSLYDGTSLVVEILDIDDFKGYNDSMGHQQGDECLVEVANAIKSMEKEHGAFAARYGGDEFILIYQNITKDQAISYAAELKQKVMDLNIPYPNSKIADVVTITQGLCWDIPVSPNRMWDYLHAADTMLYRMKNKQRNNYCIGNLKGTEEDIIMSC